MSNIREYEGNPGKEQVPDQADVTACITVRHACCYQSNAYRTGSIEQYKDGNIVPVAYEKVSKLVEHNIFRSLRGGGFPNG
jgi:hypothetical protein